MSQERIQVGCVDFIFAHRYPYRSHDHQLYLFSLSLRILNLGHFRVYKDKYTENTHVQKNSLNFYIDNKICAFMDLQIQNYFSSIDLFRIRTPRCRNHTSNACQE